MASNAQVKRGKKAGPSRPGPAFEKKCLHVADNVKMPPSLRRVGETGPQTVKFLGRKFSHKRQLLQGLFFTSALPFWVYVLHRLKYTLDCGRATHSSATVACHGSRALESIVCTSSNPDPGVFTCPFTPCKSCFSSICDFLYLRQKSCWPMPTSTRCCQLGTCGCISVRGRGGVAIVLKDS